MALFVRHVLLEAAAKQLNTGSRRHAGHVAIVHPSHSRFCLGSIRAGHNRHAVNENSSAGGDQRQTFTQSERGVLSGNRNCRGGRLDIAELGAELYGTAQLGLKLSQDFGNTLLESRATVNGSHDVAFDDDRPGTAVAPSARTETEDEGGYEGEEGEPTLQDLAPPQPIKGRRKPGLETPRNTWRRRTTPPWAPCQDDSSHRC